LKRDDTVYLRHVIDAAGLIEEYLEDRDYQEFAGNRMLQDAVVREIEIIGEAVKNISPNTKERYADIPWRQIAGMRDKLIHGYFGVDIGAVWDTAAKDIPSLKEKVLRILEDVATG